MTETAGIEAACFFFLRRQVDIICTSEHTEKIYSSRLTFFGNILYSRHN